MADSMLSNRDNICKWFEELASREISNHIQTDDDRRITRSTTTDDYFDEDVSQSTTTSDEQALAGQELLRDPVESMDKDPVADHERRSYSKLKLIHKNLGHPSNTVLAKILREAGAPKSLIDSARDLPCEVCDRFKSTQPARPAKAHHYRALGECLGLDLSYFRRTKDGNSRGLLLHMIDEASKFHVIRVVKEGEVDHDNALGNITAERLVDILKESWFRYFQTPAVIHTDSEGVFKSNHFLQACNEKGIRVVTTAGEAHWQLGIVERHIKTANETIHKLALDAPESTSLQDLADQACEAKNSYGYYHGYSPAQWQLSRQHPLTKTTEVPPLNEDDSPFVRHLQRRHQAASAFLEAEAKTILRLASHARSRELKTISPGDVVYYFRVGKGAGAKAKGSYRGPARVLAVEPPEGAGSRSITVVWLSHGAQLIRAAPEHLRMATPLEIEVDQFVTGPQADPKHPISRTLVGKRKAKYVDLGAAPSAEAKLDAMEEGEEFDDGEDGPQAKRQRADGYMPGDDAPQRPPPSPHRSPSSSTSSPSSSSLPSRPRTPSRESSTKYRAIPTRLDRDRNSDRSRSDRRRRDETDLFGPTTDDIAAPTPPAAQPGDQPAVPMDLRPFDPLAEAPQSPSLPSPPSPRINIDPETGLPELPFQHMIPQRPGAEQLADQGYKPLNTPTGDGATGSADSMLYTHNIHNIHNLNSATRLTDQHQDEPTPYYVDPTANAQAAYAHYLTTSTRSHKHKTTYVPRVSFALNSKQPKELRKGQWKNHVFEYSMDVTADDLKYLAEETDPVKLLDHFALMSSEAKRHQEVNLKQLTPQEKKLFEQAKSKELDQWISNSVFSIAKKSGVPLDRIMSMRWVLTWKYPEGDLDVKTRKAKARLVVKGFTDPDLTTIRAESPTLSRLAKHWLFQIAASNNWKLTKGDVKTAFLQGDRKEQQRNVYVQPTAEIRRLLGLSDDELMKLEAAVYGLRNAPRAWYERIKGDLLKIGCRQHKLDSCLFCVYEGDQLVGLIGIYVDDCLMAGDNSSKKWRKVLDDLYKTYTWSPWEYEDFLFTGTHVKQSKTGSIRLDQSQYAKTIRQVETSSADLERDLAPHELKAMRGADGSLQWLVTNTRLDLAAPTSISQGNHSNPKVRHVQELNKIIRTAHSQPDVPVYFQTIPLDKLSLLTFHDAGQGSRPDGSSQGGFIIAAADQGILKGEEHLLSLIDWRSFRLKRVARSSLAAEVQAFAEALDALEFCKLFLAEILEPTGIDLRNGADKAIQSICESPLITDCKSLYDAVERSQSTGLNLAERRTSIEVLACRERMATLGMHVRWVNSDRQLADGLTKSTAAWKLSTFQTKPTMRLVWDPEFTAAKKLKKEKATKVTKTAPPTDSTTITTSPSPSPSTTNKQHSNINKNNKSNMNTNKHINTYNRMKKPTGASTRRPAHKATTRPSTRPPTRAPAPAPPPPQTTHYHDTVWVTPHGAPGNGRGKFTNYETSTKLDDKVDDEIAQSINFGMELKSMD